MAPIVRRWAVSLVATALSTYALDAGATAAGVLLVASGLLDGLDHRQAVAFLVTTNVIWALGLRAGVRANWALLAATGTSTNVLSKAAHDLTRRRTTSVRAARLAAACGYLGMELVKEVPYYGGAFGAALLTDSVSSTAALVFLGGANLGAAAYEGGLARLTGLLLRRRRKALGPAPAEVSTAPDRGG
ncbi:hypothetical protein [Actinoplanes sp. NPDC026623]|uniref:hypothetical protein n=1 Tax=Actinoplanes sp. NPDC026623 TaxID=3155610 RepID=UPI0033EF916D